jgi:hypothetical protein
MSIYKERNPGTIRKAHEAMVFTIGAQHQRVINVQNNNREISRAPGIIGPHTARARIGRGTARAGISGPTGFQVLDSLITHLDALFSQLPP